MSNPLNATGHLNESEHPIYTCPGELYSIPRSIHLARLAAFYPKCRDCAHRFDGGHAFPRPPEPNRETDRLAVRNTMLTDENVRGIYLNELDRNRALKWGESLAADLWNERPLVARPKSTELAFAPPLPPVAPQAASASAVAGPTVVVAFDERPSSPDIVTGLVLGLRRMGCPVIDLGQASLPTLIFNVQALDAAAGVLVTGAGCDLSFTGFDFVGRGGLPFSAQRLLNLEQLTKTDVGRQTRQVGIHQPCQGQLPYEANLEPYFHALRPLSIVCGSSTRWLPRTIDRLFAKLPCTIKHVPLPIRRRNLLDASDADLLQVATSVVDGRHHLGVIIDDDGQHVAFVTDQGRLVNARDVARLLFEISQREHRHAQFVVATSWHHDVTHWLQGRDASLICEVESISDLIRLLLEREALLAISADGRVWFRQSYPTCDALLVLARTLQVLSLSDAPFSEVVSRIDRNDVQPQR
ncbi:phosphohexomutase domain-containing protein [Schlesneria paludicola]|uniref:phosphoglucomutase/phosphomannomutase alpha/beta/alpha domain I n=1 Tax=Schlesneria paludicola TaxID=360056 RepID=UPI00029A5D70|nr:phosphoglucomutase/phosphomannomutase alpha/beta/alpha domain I [Schlesneria paludicola]